MLEGLVQNDHPLTLHHILDRMRRVYGASEVVTLTDDGPTRATYADVAGRVDKLAHALKSLGIKEEDRVATFAWNTQRHLEIYMAAPCMGAVLHTLNIRLFAEQLEYIVNHAEDRVVLVDPALARRARGLTYHPPRGTQNEMFDPGGLRRWRDCRGTGISIS